MFCDSNYFTNKETRISVRGTVTTLGGTLITCPQNTQRSITLIITEAYCVALSACAQEVKFVNVLLK